MDELLNESLKNIEQQTRSREIENNKEALLESMQEIENAKLFVKEFTEIRNKAVKNLYNVGVSAKSLSEITGISTVYIHRIVK